MTAEEFARLYDEHERAVFNFCLRLTGSHDDAADATQEAFAKVLERLPALDERELNFGAYVMTAARNASYDVIGRRRRAMPSDDLPDIEAPVADAPESFVLRDAHAAQVRAANHALPPRQREVLALRELAELSYDQVAEVMGMNRNSVAQLISRARINLRDGLRQTALGSVASASPLCDRALPLLAMRQDGVLEDDGWLAEHLAGCGTCRVRMEAMEEAGVAYRLWLPVAAAPWLAGAVDAHASARLTSVRRVRRSRRVALAGVAGAVIVFLALLAGDARSPERAFVLAAAAEPTATPEPEPEPEPIVRAEWKPAKVQPRRAKLHRVPRAATPAPAVEAPDVGASTPPATEAPAPPERRAARRAKPDPEPTPAPTAAPEPVVVSEPPPSPPAGDPDPDPPPPPPPPSACGVNCPGSVVNPTPKPPKGPQGFQAQPSPPPVP